MTAAAEDVVRMLGQGADQYQAEKHRYLDTASGHTYVYVRINSAGAGRGN